MSQSSSSERVYDLIGLGFGPANLAIAGAVIEKFDSTDPKDVRYLASRTSLCHAVLTNFYQECHILSCDNVLFIEKQEEFRWHPGMLLPGAQMQIRFVSYAIHIIPY